MESVKTDPGLWHIVVKKIISKNLCRLKNSINVKHIVDYMIQTNVLTLDEWMGLKSKPISENERTEEFLWLLTKSNQDKFNHFLESLIQDGNFELYNDLKKERDEIWPEVKKENELPKMKDNHLKELERNIKQLNDTIKKKDADIHTLQNDNNELKRKLSNKLEASEAAQNITTIEHRFLIKEIDSLRQEVVGLKVKTTDLEHKLETVQEKNEDMKDKIGLLEKHISPKNGQTTMKCEERSKTMTATTELNREIEMLKNEMTKQDILLQKMNQEKEDNVYKLKQLKETNESLKKTNKALIARCTVTPRNPSVSLQRISSFKKT